MLKVQRSHINYGTLFIFLKPRQATGAQPTHTTTTPPATMEEHEVVRYINNIECSQCSG